MLLHLDLLGFGQVVQIANESRYCPMPLRIVSKAEFKELQSIQYNCSIRNLSALFL